MVARNIRAQHAHTTCAGLPVDAARGRERIPFPRLDVSGFPATCLEPWSSVRV